MRWGRERLNAVDTPRDPLLRSVLTDPSVRNGAASLAIFGLASINLCKNLWGNAKLVSRDQCLLSLFANSNPLPYLSSLNHNCSDVFKIFLVLQRFRGLKKGTKISLFLLRDLFFDILTNVIALRKSSPPDATETEEQSTLDKRGRRETKDCCNLMPNVPILPLTLSSFVLPPPWWSWPVLVQLRLCKHPEVGWWPETKRGKALL